MNKISIVFAVNDAYVEHLNIAVYSLLKNNPKSYFDIYILSGSLTDRSQRSIRKILTYYENISIKFIDLRNMKSRFNRLRLNVEHTSAEIYYKYVIAEVFPDLDRVIYFDADILVSGDISELARESLDGFYAAGVNDFYVDSLGDKVSGGDSYKESIGFKRDELYINAGVLVMNLKKIRTDDISTKLFNNTIRLVDKIKFQDQDILNITMQGKVKAISNVYNYTDKDKGGDNKKLTDVKIIHYTGPTKPWSNVVPVDFQVPFVRLYKKYVDEYNKLVNQSTDKFALYAFSTENIGDDIQSIAARRFIPRVDHYINRDLVGEWKNADQKESVKLIANGWYMHPPYSWPIKDSTIDPLYISMYVEQSSPEVIDRFLSKKSIMNFRKAGRIGARDSSTYDFFKKNEIDAYLSGCLTLTLQKDPGINKQDFILLTDVSHQVYEYVKGATDKKVIYLTNAINTAMLQKQREELAEIYLYLYQSAQCVITERLHSALLCLALDTPTLLIKKDRPIGGNSNRLSGLGGLAHYYTEDEFLSGRVYDINRPPKNPNKYLDYRKSLIKACAEFTGFNNKRSFAWTDIGEKSLGEVLARLEMIKVTNLKSATTEMMRLINQKDDLHTVLEQKNIEIERQSRELARLMGIKAAARRLAGNVTRRVTGVKK